MPAPQDGSSLPRLVRIMQQLLAPDGCPWDREQTLDTLRPFVIEEAYEVVEAIESGDPEALREELGDLLLQIVFQAELARARDWFGPDDVVAAICEKLVRRHPHVFADTRVASAQEVMGNWEKIKAQEKKHRGALEGVPATLPALLRAARVSEKAERLGIGWPDHREIREKVDEELSELDEAVASGDEAAAERELGDTLFALASLAGKLGFDPEHALRDTLQRFTRRVEHVEQSFKASGRGAEERSREELDALWRAAKSEHA